MKFKNGEGGEKMKCKKCGQEMPEEKKGIKITSRYDSNTVLFQSTKDTMKEAVVEAVKKDADLSDADLKGADLKGADLKGVNLRGADLRYADLSDADLKGVNLSDADLSSADLKGADLKGAKTRMCTINFSSYEYEQAKQFIEGLKL